MSPDKQLFVLRHAKSSWKERGLDDHERPLSARGRRAVRALSEHMRATGVLPAQVLCSSARRTRETLEGVLAGCEPMIEPELYTASTAELIERLQLVSVQTPSVMIIGHNPAMQTLVLRLAGDPAAARADDTASNLADVRRKFPTGALATLRFTCAWSDLAPGCATLASYVRPNALH